MSPEAGRAADPPVAGPPQAGDGPQQRAFAAAAGADDHQALAGVDGEGQVADQGALAVRRPQGQPVDVDPRILDELDALVAGGVVLPVHEAGEAVQPVDAGGELAEALEVVDDHRQRRQDRREGARRLDGPAHLELAGQDPPGDDRAGQHDGHEAVGVLEQVEPELRPDEPAGVAVHRVEVLVHLAGFARFAGVEGDRLGVLADAHQAEAEIRLAPELVEVEPHQHPPEQAHGDGGAHHRIDDQEEHQLPGDRPQDAREGRQLQHRAGQHEQELEGFLGEGVDVLGDPLVRVVDLGAGVQPVVHPVAQVGGEVVAGQPAPPAQAEGVADVVVEGVGGHRHHQQHQALADRRPEPRLVVGGQRRGEFAGLGVEEHREQGLTEEQRDEERQQPQGAPPAVAEPVGPGNLPEAPEELTVEGDHGRGGPVDGLSGRR